MLATGRIVRGREKRETPHKVLVVTGGLLNEAEPSLATGIKKKVRQLREAESPWLDLKVSAVVAEPVVAAHLERRRMRKRGDPASGVVEDFFETSELVGTPELTEVVLATLLEREGIDYVLASYTNLYSDPEERERVLAETSCVFASTTLLHDLSEILPLVRMLKRPHNRTVLGGALAGTLCHDWDGAPEVDVLAVGYGEMLVPALAPWIRSGFTEALAAPERGRIVERAHTRVVHSGVPETKDLDFLVTPDWGLSARDHGLDYDMVYYESVRGCPYRCGFCNYPYLFDDTKFRFKSAKKIADGWQHYTDDLGVKYITALDSLFTMPRGRLRELCATLIDRGLNERLRWICYARADDLADEDMLLLMKRAGVHQVQSGIESGHQTVLDNMNKVCSVDANRQALLNCRKHGVTTAVSLIAGYPGETAETLDATFEFLRGSPPDFYFLAALSTRVPGVPLLTDESRERFGLRVHANKRTMAPYWEHDTMSCREVGNLIREFNRRIAEHRVTLNAAIFFGGMLRFRPEQRGALLDFQRRAAMRGGVLGKTFDGLNGWIDRRLIADMERRFPTAEPATA